jgi:hypothetical protein
MRGPGRKVVRPIRRRARLADTLPDVPVQVSETPGKSAEASTQEKPTTQSATMDDKVRRMIEAAYA